MIQSIYPKYLAALNRVVVDVIIPQGQQYVRRSEVVSSLPGSAEISTLEEVTEARDSVRSTAVA